ncbi:hypothetical protein OOT46_28380 [Aquabacterium sp. A7-Y]|uniref:hypothetical protein n=1 Tax=Aquabacterium sp. A7-Y TaxID=1349605 RepID=UPI00223DE49A|nr:hypothetical protein [Aquabacterium sp. A7-Y]MCW7541719.1 hypothetical protein [Aquabacterium sp. A7-Y]
MNARALFASAVLALGGLAAVPAQAGDIRWSVAVHGPGVTTTVGNARPVVVHAPPPQVWVHPVRSRRGDHGHHHHHRGRWVHHDHRGGHDHHGYHGHHRHHDHHGHGDHRDGHDGHGWHRR